MHSTTVRTIRGIPVPLLPWALFITLVCMHCGTVGGAHVLWLFLVATGLFAAMIVSEIALVRSRRSASRAPSSP